MWEYNFVKIPDEEYPNHIEHLNNAGKEGWEFTGHVNDTGYGVEYLMKRKVVSSKG